MLFSQFIESEEDFANSANSADCAQSKCNERACNIDEEDIDLEKEDSLSKNTKTVRTSKSVSKTGMKNKMVKNAVSRKLTNAEKAKIRELRRQRGIRTQREKDWDYANDWEYGDSWNTMGKSSYGMFESDNNAENELIRMLPTGNGIDDDWQIEKITRRQIILTNAWHYLSGNGYYLGWIDFKLVIDYDGSYDLELVYPIEDLAQSPLGAGIAKDILSDDPDTDDEDYEELTEDEIREIIESEIDSILDNIYRSIKHDCSKELAKCAQMLIK